MIRVNLYDRYDNEIETELPIIPKLGEKIGLFIEDCYEVVKVDHVLLTLKKDGSFDYYYVSVDCDFKV